MKMRSLFHVGIGLTLFLLNSPRPSFAQVVTYIDQNFEGYNTGPLSSGSGWGVGSGLGVQIVGAPVAEGSRALQITRTTQTGSVSYTTNTTAGPNTPLILTGNSSYQWSFDFRLDSSTVQPSGTGVLWYTYLDTTNVGSGFGGMAIRYDITEARYQVLYYNTLSGGVTSLGNYTFLADISLDAWYSLSFDLSINAANQLAYGITLTGGESPVTASVTSQTSAAGFAAGNYVRMVWSPQGDNRTMQFDNLYLASVPEPSTLALIVLGVGGVLWTRSHRMGVLS